MLKKLKLRLTGSEVIQIVGGAVAVSGIGLAFGVAVALIVGGIAAVGVGTLTEMKGSR